jgi:sterol 3beta-glucosyltransferase
MKITVLTSGSRGDAQPYLALALGLKARGHDVRFAAQEPARALVEAYGMQFAPIGVERNVMLEDEGNRTVLAKVGRNPLAVATRIGGFVRLAEQMASRLLGDAAGVCQGTDLILCAAHNFYAGEAVAKALGCRLAYLCLQPLTPSKQVPNLLFPAWPTWLRTLGRSQYCWASHWLTLQPIWFLTRGRLNRIRRQVLDLPPHPGSFRMLTISNGAERLHGYSEVVLPRPSDWSANQHVCGYWFLDPPPHWQPPPTLQSFLASGPAPVVVGFSSVIDGQADEMTDWIVTALRQTGQRGILVRGWGGLRHPGSSAGDMFCTDDIPHGWLLPKCHAVIHHGGAGTTGAALRAGLPALVIPYVSDQFFWARRLRELGAATQPLPRSKASLTSLVRGLQAIVAGSDLRQTAAALGARLRADDGVTTAITVLTERGVLD